MSVGVYGIGRASDVLIDDVDIFYNYAINRSVDNLEMYRLDANELLQEIELPEDENDGENDNLLEGMYNLKLPSTIFNEIGIYTIYLKPKSFRCKINDCGVLTTMSNMSGIVVKISDLPDGFDYNNSLQGYKIEYYDHQSGEKMRNVVRYIVTSNKVVVVNDNNTNNSQSSNKYKFDETGDLIFLQLTPSSASTSRPNQIPFIGVSGQSIQISNTFFEPLMIEVEMVDSDLDTLVDIVAGEQIKDVDNGILTHFDKDRNITRQFDLYKVEDRENNIPLYEVKQKRDNIDMTQDIQDIVDKIE